MKNNTLLAPTTWLRNGIECPKCNYYKAHATKADELKARYEGLAASAVDPVLAAEFAEEAAWWARQAASWRAAESKDAGLKADMARRIAAADKWRREGYPRD